MDLKPVNSINNDANTIRVSDGNSPIRLIFKDAKGAVINLYDKIDYFYLTKDDEKFYSVTDISYQGDEVIIRLPKLRKGKYKAEIRDKDGSIYPANEDLYILLRRSFEDDKDIYYFGHREDILNSVEPMVIQHIDKNPNKFKGERGQQGFPGRDGLRGIDGKDGKDGIDGEKGDKGDQGIQGIQGKQGIQGIKGDKGDKGDPGKDFDKNSFLVDQTMISDELKQQIAGTAPINAVPADNSITNVKLDSVVYGKILDAGTNANSLDVPGFYTVTSGQRATEELNFPPGNQFGVLDVRHLGLNTISQSYTMHSTGEIWTRRRYVGNWSKWVKIGNDIVNTLLLGDKDLNEITDTGEWRQVNSANVSSVLNYPDITGNVSTGTLLVSNASGSISQTYIADRAGEIFVRDRNVAGRWFEWKKVGGTNESGRGDGNSVPKTDMEITGRWTSNDAGDNFMFEMGKHELVEIIEAGRSVRDRPIYAAVIGDPTKPAYYINAASHGTEVGAAEAAWLLVREFTQEKSLMLMDMCIIVLPNQNPDNRFIARGNKNAVDINRDWVDKEQPETHAAMHILNNYNVVAATDLHNFGYARHVSLKEAIYGTPEVMAKSQELFDLVTTTLENDDQLVRRYNPEAPNSSFTNGVAEQWNVPTLLIEIPCGGFNDWTFDHYYPTPYWQAYVGGLACKAIAKYVWKNLTI